MTGRPRHSEDTHPTVPQGLIDDLQAIYGRKVAVPGALDRRIRAEARRQLVQPGRYRRVVGRLVAAAACLALVMAGTTALCLWRASRSVGPGPVVPAAAEPELMGVLARLDAAGQPTNEWSVRAGQTVVAAGQRLRLRIWNRHEITLEPGTRLASHRDDRGGCVIALAEGQILASVNRVPGEGVFQVVTPQADCVVTGTVFTIAADFDRTRLSVHEGTVKMASRRGYAQPVMAGQAFATDGTALTRVSPDSLEALLASACATQSCPWSTLRQSPWYRARFAPLLALGDYLAGRGVAVDEREILALSAEPWSLQYPQAGAGRVRPFAYHRAGLERVARYYGQSVRWLEPAGLDEAEDLVQQASERRELVLGFGAGTDHVQVLSGGDDPVCLTELQPYRFLGEPKAKPMVLCAIAPSDEALPDRDILVAGALADIRTLLDATSDPEFIVGRPAIRAWARGFETQVVPDLNDPLLQALDGLARIWPEIEPVWSRWVAPVPAGVDVSASARQLTRDIRELFTLSAFETTYCSQMERQEVAGTFVAAVERLLDGAGRFPGGDLPSN